MNVRCPSCCEQIESPLTARLSAIVCPSCGSSFSLVDTEATTEYQAGTRLLGHFELIEEVGFGKFGSVWKARDTKLRRDVAIKIPRRGRLDSQEAELFLRDARAAAQLKHPHIVGVHEVGREAETLYIVSDYIEGANLREWLSGQRLAIREAAEVVVKIARALHYAHEAGVVHRDLKPSNVMIDVAGVPHVIDFGLARRADDDVTLTADGQVLGTPAYMSPEQARGKGHEADRRADVYSLGVILFELLTGELPFRGEARMLIVQIVHEEPPSPRRLNARVSRDLETITLKCLQKDPARRYQTSAELADDLDRFLSGEPIRARPVGRVERSWRWCKRNRAVAGLGTTVILVLAAAVGVSSYYAFAARARAREAMSERTRAESNLAEATRQRERAATGFARARQAVDTLTDVSEDKLANTPGIQPLRKELLQSALAYYEGLAQDLADAPTVRAELSATYKRVGDIRSSIGEETEAIQSYSQAIQILVELVEKHPDKLEYKSALAAAYRSLAIAQLRLERSGAAKASYHKAIELWEQLVDRDPASLEYQIDLAATYARLASIDSSDSSEVRQLQQKAMALQEKLVERSPADVRHRAALAESYYRYGMLQIAEGRRPQGEMSFQKAIAIFEELVDENAAAQAHQSGLAACYHAMGHQAEHSGAPRPEPGEWFRKAMIIQEKLARENPAVVDYQVALSMTYNCFARWSSSNANLADAEKAYRQAIEIDEVLVQSHPELSRPEAAMLPHYPVLEDQPPPVSQVAGAESNSRRAFEIAQLLAARNPSSHNYRRILNDSYLELTRLQAKLGQPERAIQTYEDAIARQESLPADPDEEDLRRQTLAYLYAGLATHLALGNKDPDRVVEMLDKAEGYAGDSVPSLIMCAHAEAVAGRWGKAAEVVARAGDISNDYLMLMGLGLMQLAAGEDAAYRTTCRQFMQHFGGSRSLAVKSALLITCLSGEKALDDFEPLVEIARDLVDRNPLNPAYATGLGGALYNAGHVEEAIEVLRAGLPLHLAAVFVVPDARDQIHLSQMIAELLLARAYRQLGNAEESQKFRRRAEQVIANLESAAPNYDPGLALWAAKYGAFMGRRNLRLFLDSPLDATDNAAAAGPTGGETGP